jgi:hypothetical protein
MEKRKATGLTTKSFIEFFRKVHGWECKPGTRITNDLTSFAKERLGSSRDKHELYIIFCLAHGIRPYPAKENLV